MQRLKTVPDISNSFRVLTVRVRGSDPRWSKIESRRYAYCSSKVRPDDFLVDPTDREVVVAVFPPNYFDNPSNEQVIDEIARRNMKNPDRAVTETVLDVLKDELAGNPTVGICGIRSEADGDSAVGIVSGSARGRDLDIRALQSHWARLCQFIAVVSETLL